MDDAITLSDRDWNVDDALEHLKQLYFGNEDPQSAVTKSFQKSLNSYVNRDCFVTGRDSSSKIEDYWTYQQILTIAQLIHEYGSKKVQVHLIPTLAAIFVCPAAQRLLEIFAPCLADAAIKESSSLEDIVRIIPDLLLTRFNTEPPKTKRPRLGSSLDTSWSCILQWWLLRVQCVLEGVDRPQDDGDHFSLLWSSVCSNSIKIVRLGHSGLSIPHLACSRDAGLSLLALHLMTQKNGPFVKSSKAHVQVQGLTPQNLIHGNTGCMSEDETRPISGTLARSVGCLVNASGLPSYNLVMFLVELLNTIAQGLSQDVYGETCEELQQLLEQQGISTMKPVIALSTAEKDGVAPREYDEAETSLRSKVSTVGYPLVEHVKHMLSRGDLGAAMQNVRNMDKSVYINQHERAELWSNVLGYLKSTGQIFIDGNYRWLDEDKRKRELLMSLNGAMGSRTSRLVLQKFYTMIVKDTEAHSGATGAEKAYVTHAAKRTLLGLMTHDFGNEDEQIQVFLSLFPDIQGMAATPEQRLQWKKDFFDREVTPPESLEVGVVRGRVNMAIWDDRVETERLRLVAERKRCEEGERRESERLRREEEERIFREAEEKRVREEAQRRQLEEEERRRMEAERQRLAAEAKLREEGLRLAAQRRLEMLRLEAEEQARAAADDAEEQESRSRADDEQHGQQEDVAEYADETEEHAEDATNPDILDQHEEDVDSSVVEVLEDSSDAGGGAGEAAGDNEEGVESEGEQEQTNEIEIIETSDEEPEPADQPGGQSEEDGVDVQEINSDDGGSAKEIAVLGLVGASASDAEEAALDTQARVEDSEDVAAESLKETTQEAEVIEIPTDAAKVETGYEPEAGSHTEDDGVSEEFQTEDEEEAPPTAPKPEEMPPPQRQRAEHFMSDDMSAADERTAAEDVGTESSEVDEGGPAAVVALPTADDTAEVAPPLLQYAISAQSQRDTGEELATDVSRTEERPEAIVNRVPDTLPDQNGDGTSAATVGMSEITGQYTTDEEMGHGQQSKVESKPPVPDYTADIDTEPEQPDTKIPAEPATPRGRHDSDATEDFPTPVEGTNTENIPSSARTQSEDDGSEGRHVSFADQLGGMKAKVHLDMGVAVEDMKRPPLSRDPSTLAVKGDPGIDSSLEDDQVVDKVPAVPARAPGLDRFKSTDAVVDDEETHASLNDTSRIEPGGEPSEAAVPPVGNDSIPTQFVDQVPVNLEGEVTLRPGFDRMKSTDAVCGDDSSPMSIEDAATASDQGDEPGTAPGGNESGQHERKATDTISIDEMDVEPEEGDPMETEPVEPEQAMGVDSVGGDVHDNMVDSETKEAEGPKEGIDNEEEVVSSRPEDSARPISEQGPQVDTASDGAAVASNSLPPSHASFGSNEGEAPLEDTSNSKDDSAESKKAAGDGGDRVATESVEAADSGVQEDVEEAALSPAYRSSWDEEAEDAGDHGGGAEGVGDISDRLDFEEGQRDDGPSESAASVDTSNTPRRSPRRPLSPERDQDFVWPLQVQVQVHSNNDQGNEEAPLPGSQEQPEEEKSNQEHRRTTRSQRSSSQQSDNGSVGSVSSRRSARLAARRDGRRSGHNSSNSSIVSTSSRRSARVAARTAAREAGTDGLALDPIPEEDTNRNSSLDTTATARRTDNQKQKVVMENMEFLEENPEEESSDDSKPRTRSSGRPKSPPRHRPAGQVPTRAQPKRGRKSNAEKSDEVTAQVASPPKKRGRAARAKKTESDLDEPDSKLPARPKRSTRSKKSADDTKSEQTPQPLGRKRGPRKKDTVPASTKQAEEEQEAQEKQPKKKRGRPPKKKPEKDEAAQDTARAEPKEEQKQESEPSATKKKRGRPRKKPTDDGTKGETPAPRRSTRRRPTGLSYAEDAESEASVASTRPRRTRATRSTRSSRSSADDDSENLGSRKSIGDESSDRRKSGGSMASRTRSHDHKSRSGKTYFR